MLVDEVQDTNAVQYELLKALVGERAPFTAVGDDDQSIYGWRGATIDNLKRLPQDYPKLKVIPLEQNYRSTGAILRAANHVIAANPKLYEKKLWSEHGDGEPVSASNATARSTRPSARWRGSRPGARTGERPLTRPVAGSVKLRDFAMLYRANHQAQVFEQKLRARRSRTRFPAGRASSTAPRSRTCAPGCACW